MKKSNRKYIMFEEFENQSNFGIEEVDDYLNSKYPNYETELFDSDIYIKNIPLHKKNDMENLIAEIKQEFGESYTLDWDGIYWIIRKT